jgi:alkylated DNA nucleotide flippase Atl1
MPKSKTLAFARIRAEVFRVFEFILAGKFATCGSIAIHLIVVVRHIAAVSSRWTVEDSASLPWSRVVGVEARISLNRPALIAFEQRTRLEVEGLILDAKGYI